MTNETTEHTPTQIEECQIEKAYSCKPDMNVCDVAKFFKEGKARYLFVVDAEEKLLGIISPVDVTCRVVAENKDAMQTTAKDIMTSPIDSIEGCGEVERGYLMMLENDKHVMPVVHEGKLVGVLSFGEAVRILSHKHQLIKQHNLDEAVENEGGAQ